MLLIAENLADRPDMYLPQPGRDYEVHRDGHSRKPHAGLRVERIVSTPNRVFHLEEASQRKEVLRMDKTMVTTAALSSKTWEPLRVWKTGPPAIQVVRGPMRLEMSKNSLEKTAYGDTKGGAIELGEKGNHIGIERDLLSQKRSLGNVCTLSSCIDVSECLVFFVIPNSHSE